MISRVQSTSGVNSTGATANIATSAFTSTITPGNTIIVGVTYDAAAGSCTGVTDSNGNTYTKVQASSRRGCEIWVCYQVKGGASNVVTAALSFVDGVVFADEWVGLAPSSFDVGTNTTTNTINPSATTASTNLDAELVFACVLNDVPSTVYTVGTGYSNLVSGAPSFCYGASESKVVAAAGAQTAAFVGGTAGNSWDLAIATFKAGGPSFRVNPIRPHPFSPGLAR